MSGANKWVLTVLAGAVATAPGAVAGVGGEEISVIVQPGTGTGPLDAVHLQAIFSVTQRSWDDGKAIIAFNLSPGSDARTEFDRVVMSMTPDQVGRYWIDQAIRSGRRAPRQVADPLLAVRLIAKLPGSIGYVPAHQVDASVRVVARIRDGRVLPP
jgi:ABC-type phosphate transport system substrate-binding protein